MNFFHEMMPGRWVEIEAQYSCQRWPEGTRLIHDKSQRELEVLSFAHEGFWVGWTGMKDGQRIERYILVPYYRVKVLTVDFEKILPDTEMHEP